MVRKVEKKQDKPDENLSVDASCPLPGLASGRETLKALERERRTRKRRTIS